MARFLYRHDAHKLYNFNLGDDSDDEDNDKYENCMKYFLTWLYKTRIGIVLFCIIPLIVGPIAIYSPWFGLSAKDEAGIQELRDIDINVSFLSRFSRYSVFVIICHACSGAETRDFLPVDSLSAYLGCMYGVNANI